MFETRFSRWVTTLCLIVLAIAGCASRPVAVGVEYCGNAQPIYWDSDADLMATPLGITRQVVEHNELYERLCKR